jgi:hypothetical protein
MDNKTVFVRTTKGEEQSQSRTSHLSGDVKRALLMVDGSATFGAISKRSAPSMRANLAEIFEEMQKSGLIQDKSFVGKIPKLAAPGGKKHPVDSDSGELDFMSEYSPAAPKVDKKAEQQRAARIQEETALRAKKEAEATRQKAELEAKRVREELEAAKRKAEQEAKLRIEAAEREQKAAEAARVKAEQAAKRVREELEAAKRKAEQEAKLRIEAAERERKEAEAARVKAEQEAARIKAEQEAKLRQEAEERARKEAEAARVKAEQEAKLRREAEERKRKEAEAARIKAEQEAARVKAEHEAAQMKVELELVKRRAELEAEARLEAEAKARALVEAEQAENERKEAESPANQEQEAAQEIEQATEQNETDTTETATPDKFAFDEFQIDESGNEKSLQQTESRKESAPEQKGKPEKAVPASKKQDTFAFDSFNVDEQQRPDESRKSDKSRKDEQSAVSAKQHETSSDAGKDAERKEQLAQEERKAREEQKAREERESQERIAAEQQIAEKAKAKEQADAQSKVWAEAEQRALETAKANADRAVHSAEYSPETVHEKPAYVARKPRKPFAWGKLVGFVVKLGIFLLVLLIGALFIIPSVLPMRDYMPKVQQLLSDRLHQPVHLGYLSGRILPSPRLDLGEIYIGNAKQFQAGTAQINFDFTGVFTDEKPIDSVDFKDVKVRGMALTNAVAWLQQLASDKQYPVSRMTLSQGTLDADAFQITGVEGELDFSPAGKFTQAKLRANAGKYSLNIEATRENKLQAAITVRESALPLLPNWTFDELNAKGELSGDELQIGDFDAKLLGGDLHGEANIRWRSGWSAQGTLKTKSIPMKNINHLLDGNLAGSARFKMTSADLGSLTDSAVLDGDFTATDGVISGMDIVETARMHSKENMHGGRTHFDALSGAISFADDSYHFRRVKVDAGVLKATANFDVTKQEMSGKMNVNLSLNDSVGNVDLKMGGQIDNPTLIYAP